MGELLAGPEEFATRDNADEDIVFVLGAPSFACSCSSRWRSSDGGKLGLLGTARIAPLGDFGGEGALLPVLFGSPLVIGTGATVLFAAPPNAAGDVTRGLVP